MRKNRVVIATVLVTATSVLAGGIEVSAPPPTTITEEVVNTQVLNAVAIDAGTMKVDVLDAGVMNVQGQATVAGPLITGGSLTVGGSQILARSANYTQFSLGTAGSAVFNVDVNGLTSIQKGASNVNGTVPSIATINSTAVGTGADTTEDNLQTYSLDAASLSANNKAVRYTAWGDGVSTADATTVRCYFGATVCATKVLTAAQANTWRMVFEVIRTGATTQICNGAIINGGSVASVTHTNASPGATLSGAVTIKCTGQRATSSVADSIRQLGGIVEFFN